MPIAVFLSMMAATTANPLPDCVLLKPVDFFIDLNVLPAELRTDFESRVGTIHSATDENVNFTDALIPGMTTGKKLQFVARASNQWLISYAYDGFTVQSVTVSYAVNDRGPKMVPRMMGALRGDVCTVVNAFLRGTRVEPGWQR